MTIRATYRLQFHSQFTFRDAAQLAPYFAELGVSHIYASPIAESRKGSKHGYDVVDPYRISRERGGEEQFLEMAETLRAHGLGIVLDIVPNHMAVSPDNLWWMDILENGPASRYAKYFDIDWQSDDRGLKGKVLAPFLSTPYRDALREGSIKLVFDERAAKLVIAHFEHRLPIRGADQQALLGLDPTPTTSQLAEWNRPDVLDRLLGRQNYVLCWWRAANDRVNWRRFFDITSLIAVRIDEPEVFEAVHARPFELYRLGLIDGVRIDHVDGLADPGGYCRNLRARFAAIGQERAASDPALILVEKILAGDETLPPDWNVDGTTGYDFMHEVSAFQHAETGKAPLERKWERISGSEKSFAELARETRLEVLQSTFAGPLNQCASAFLASADAERAHDLSRPLLVRALTKVLCELHKYRFYRSTEASQATTEVFDHAKESASEDEEYAMTFIRDVFAQARRGEANAGKATSRFHQLSASLSAKAVEDTAFYRHGRLISRNEVGSDPDIFSLSDAEFHRKAQARARNFPRAMLATATHDHKRGEDSRARLAVLSEIPEAWARAVDAWFALIAPYRAPLIEDDTVYMLFQVIVGAWPLVLQPNDDAGLSAFRARLRRYLEKALRESKRKTSWVRIDSAYEAAAFDLLGAIFDRRRSTSLLASLADFVAQIAPAAAANSLVQTALRLTMPGIPDFYQGTEYWDLSLVDPDNRGSVDFAARRKSLAATLDAAAATWQSGSLKQVLTRRLLTLREQEPSLFQSQDYRPLQTRGKRAAHLFAFARHSGGRTLVVVAARYTADALLDGKALVPRPEWWQDTSIASDREIPRLRAVLANGVCDFDALTPSHCLRALPVEVFIST